MGVISCDYMSYSLNSLKRVSYAILEGTAIGFYGGCYLDYIVYQFFLGGRSFPGYALHYFRCPWPWACVRGPNPGKPLFGCIIQTLYSLIRV